MVRAGSFWSSTPTSPAGICRAAASKPVRHCSTALERELREEGNIELTEPPPLIAVYFNRRISRRDHVALYVVRSFRQSAPPQPNSEIVAHGFFAPDALPKDTSRATRARIAEVLDRTGRRVLVNVGNARHCRPCNSSRVIRSFPRRPETIASARR